MTIFWQTMGQVKKSMRSAEDRRNVIVQVSTLRRDAMHILNEKIIPFWMNMRDDVNGGFYGLLDFDLHLDKKADKGVILHSRILYFFSEAAMQFGDPCLIAAAEHAYTFLMEKCIDHEYGGVFWSVTHDGKPADDSKHTYNQAFAIYALSSYYALTGNPNALRTAKELFQIVEKHCTDDRGYLEAFDRQWQPVRNDKLSENNIIASRTMNTLLHVFEGYSNLYKQTGEPEVERAMQRILHIYKTIVFNPKNRRQEVFFDENYNTLIDLHSFGHDIESSWLIEAGSDLLENPVLREEIHAIDDVLAAEIYEKAFDGQAVSNEQENTEVDTNRIWWVQAESVVGFLNMWQKHREEVKYLDAAVSVMNYIKEYLVDDRENSEWFSAVDKQGNPLRTQNIADAWKCPYHNGRMALEILRRAI